MGDASDEEVIQRIYDAIASGDLTAAAQWLHPDVVHEHNPGGGSPEEGTYRGREDVVGLFERIIEPWEYVRAQPDEIRRGERGSYQVRGRMRAKHATAAGEIVTPFEQRFEFEGGLLVRGRLTFGQLGVPGPE